MKQPQPLKKSDEGIKCIDKCSCRTSIYDWMILNGNNAEKAHQQRSSGKFLETKLQVHFFNAWRLKYDHHGCSLLHVFRRSELRQCLPGRLNMRHVDLWKAAYETDQDIRQWTIVYRCLWSIWTCEFQTSSHVWTKSLQGRLVKLTTEIPAASSSPSPGCVLGLG